MLADEDGLEEDEMQGESILERVSYLYKDVKTACQDMAALIFFFWGCTELEEMVDCVLLYDSYAAIAKENTSETLRVFGVQSSPFSIGRTELRIIIIVVIYRIRFLIS